MTIRLVSLVTVTGGASSDVPAARDLALEAGARDRRPRRSRRRPVLQDQHVLGRDVLELAAHALDLGPEALVDHQQAGARLVEHAGQHLAAQAGVDAEQGQPGVGAAAVEREQLEMVLEHHRHVAGPLLVDRPEPARAGSAPCAPTRRGTAR